jgi:hypothetical protein
LIEHLRRKLDGLIQSLVPISAQRALEARTRSISGDSSALDLLTGAVEREFLGRAAAIKRGRVSASIQRSLESTAAELRSVITRALRREPPLQAARELLDLRALSEKVYEVILDLDDFLAREALAQGLAQSGQGRAAPRDELARFDLERLEIEFEHTLAEKLYEIAVVTLSPLWRSGERTTSADVWLRSWRAWTHAYASALRSCFVAWDAIDASADEAQGGETMLRKALRRELQRHAEVARKAVLELQAGEVVRYRRHEPGPSELATELALVDLPVLDQLAGFRAS